MMLNMGDCAVFPGFTACVNPVHSALEYREKMQKAVPSSAASAAGFH